MEHEARQPTTGERQCWAKRKRHRGLHAIPIGTLPVSINTEDGLTFNDHLAIPGREARSWPHEHDDEPISADEMSAIMWELSNAYGYELTDEIVEQAIEENLESKRTPSPISSKPDRGGGISHLDPFAKKVAS